MIPPKKWVGKKHLDKWGEKLQDQDTEEKEEKTFKEKDPVGPSGPRALGCEGHIAASFWCCLVLFLGQLPILQNPLKPFSYHSRSIFQILLLKFPWKLPSSPTLLLGA